MRRLLSMLIEEAQKTSRRTSVNWFFRRAEAIWKRALRQCRWRGLVTRAQSDFINIQRHFLFFFVIFSARVEARDGQPVAMGPAPLREKIWDWKIKNVLSLPSVVSSCSFNYHEKYSIYSNHSRCCFTRSHRLTKWKFFSRLLFALKLRSSEKPNRKKNSRKRKQKRVLGPLNVMGRLRWYREPFCAAWKGSSKPFLSRLKPMMNAKLRRAYKWSFTFAASCWFKLDYVWLSQELSSSHGKALIASSQLHCCWKNIHKGEKGFGSCVALINLQLTSARKSFQSPPIEQFEFHFSSHRTLTSSADSPHTQPSSYKVECNYWSRPDFIRALAFSSTRSVRRKIIYVVKVFWNFLRSPGVSQCRLISFLSSVQLANGGQSGRMSKKNFRNLLMRLPHSDQTGLELYAIA